MEDMVFLMFLTALLVLDTEVELYRAGRMSLAEYAKMPYDNDILVRIIIKKDERKAAYVTQRRTETDFPLIAVAAAKKDDTWYAAVGARPAQSISGDRGGSRLSRGTGRENRRSVSLWNQPAWKRRIQESAGADLYPPPGGRDPDKRRRRSAVMEIQFYLNGQSVKAEIQADTLLLDLVRAHGCYSVKRGCETTNCGLCTVWMEGKPVLSCSVLAARAAGQHITTLEGLQKEAEEFGRFLAGEGAEQCGFCSPGFIMNVLARERELVDPSEAEIREYLEGNLCRCTGYMGQAPGGS